MEQVIYERPDSDSRCEAWTIWDNGDVTALLVPSAVDGVTLSVAEARDIDGDGIFQRAENYWMNDDDEATLTFLRRVFDGTTLN
jgi:hypothetical protein